MIYAGEIFSTEDAMEGIRAFGHQALALVHVLDDVELGQAAVRDLAGRMGKTPIFCNDFPGFVANRVLMPMLNEAMYAVMEGVGTPEAIDAVMKGGMNHPMGPLALADLIASNFPQA